MVWQWFLGVWAFRVEITAGYLTITVINIDEKIDQLHKNKNKSL